MVYPYRYNPETKLWEEVPGKTGVTRDAIWSDSDMTHDTDAQEGPMPNDMVAMLRAWAEEAESLASQMRYLAQMMEGGTLAKMRDIIKTLTEG